MKMVCALLLMAVPFLQGRAQTALVYTVQSGRIVFFSKAPKELIEASSTGLAGALDLAKKTFAFRVGIASFQGFNSPLQQQHFSENYMETSHYPQASFTGKIIEDVDLTKDGTYELRTKGKLTIHGVSVERIVRGKVHVKEGKINLASEFTVPLVDHSIKIPRVVYDKLAPEINVSVEARMVPRN